MIDELTEHLETERTDIEDIVNGIFGESPQPADLTIERGFEELGTAILEGKYNVSRKKTTVYPLVILGLSKNALSEGIIIDSKSQIERAYANLHTQHVYNSLFDSNILEESETLASTDHFRYFFVKAYVTAIGLAVMSRFSELRGHSDGYQEKYDIEKAHLINDFAKVLASGNPMEANLDLNISAMAYHLADSSKRLDNEDFKKWITRNPLMSGPEEVQQAHMDFSLYLQQHF